MKERWMNESEKKLMNELTKERMNNENMKKGKMQK